MNKRAFFVFEPLIVIVFISMLAIAAFVVLQNKTDALKAPLGRHAGALVTTQIQAETNTFLPRELTARYAIENAVYSLAAGGGTIGLSSCQLEGMPAPDERPPVAVVADWPSIVTNFNTFVTKAVNAPVPYEFTIETPLRVSGIPLQPEPIAIPNPIPKDEAEQQHLIINPHSSYTPRLAFTANYAYRMQETYDAIRNAMFFLNDPSDLGNCRRFPTGEAKTACLMDKITILTERTRGLVRWALDAKDAATDDYILTAYHEFRMPLCKNQPVTRVKLHLPTA
ncbi:MAG TPA: hypothetical protein VLJ21_05015 [Candidatus Binatia bacterium]|nr:hypothetical protein [Candidatus Binatia bacterium]